MKTFRFDNERFIAAVLDASRHTRLPDVSFMAAIASYLISMHDAIEM